MYIARILGYSFRCFWHRFFALSSFYATIISPASLVGTTLANSFTNVNMNIVICYTTFANNIAINNIDFVENQFLDKYLISFNDFNDCITILKLQGRSDINEFDQGPVSFVFIPSSEDELEAELFEINSVFINWKNHNGMHLVWQPVVFVLWPTILKSTLSSFDEVNKNEEHPPFRTFLNINNTREILAIDNQLYFITNYEVIVNKVGSVQMQSKWDVWDMYYANSRLWVTNVVSNSCEKREGVSKSTNFTQIPWILSLINKKGCWSFIARRNFQKLPLRTVGFTKPGKANVASFDYERINKTVIKFTSGFTVDVLWYLRDSLNFTVIEYLADRYMSLHLKDGITGIGKQIVDDELDLSIALHTGLPWRAKYLDFLQPIHTEIVAAYFQQPPSNVVRDIFLWPFQPLTWLTVAVFVFIILIVLIIANIVHKLLITNESKYDAVIPVASQQHDRCLDFGEILILVVSIATLQGWKEVPKCKVVRIIFIFGMFLFLTLYACYSGSIVSALTLKVTSITHFAHFLQYGYSFLASNAVYSFYRVVPDKIEATKLLHDAAIYGVGRNDTMNKILAEGSRFASVAETEEHFYHARILNISNKLLCKLRSIVFGPRTATVGMFIQKGSPYKQFLNTKTILSFERGMGHVHKLRYEKRIQNPCQGGYSEKERFETSFQELTLADSKLMFIIVLSGTLLSVVVLMSEAVATKYL